MATKNSGYFPAPGAQNPSRYPAVGPNYIKYGEQPGWVYSPRDDKYYRSQEYRDNLIKYEQEQGLREKPPEQPKQPGLGEVILPVAATAGTIALTQGLGGKLIDTLSTTGQAPSTIQQVAQTSGAVTNAAQAPGGLLGANTGPQIAAPTSTGTLGTPTPDFGIGATPSGGEGALSAPNVVDVSRVPNPVESAWYNTPGSESTLGTVGSALATAKGIYDTHRAISGSEGGKGLETGLAEIGGGVGMYGGGPIGAAIGAAGGYATGYGIKNRDSLKGKAALAAVNPLLLGVQLGGKALGFDPLGALAHESTRFTARKHTAELLDKGKEDKPWQDYVTGMRQQFDAGPPDPSKPYGGKYATFEEAQKAGLQAADLSGVYGNLRVYGPQWAGLTQQQREAVTQLNINDNIYDPEKGEVDISDDAKAQENLKKVLSGGFNALGTAPAGGMPNKGPAPLQPGQTPASTAGAVSGLLSAMPARSKTVSPGLDKNGKRIKY